MKPHPYKVLFVCLGNICRSPAAENIFRHQVKQAGLENEIYIDSAGTIDWHAGKGPDPRMCNTLSKRHIPSDGHSRKIQPHDLADFDIILTMDESNYANVTRLDSTGRHRDKIKLFTSYCQLPEHQISEVPDPYYGGDEAFELVADILEDGSHILFDQIKEKLTIRITHWYLLH